MILSVLLTTTLWAVTPHCPKDDNSLKEVQLKEKIGTQFSEAANRVAIAEEADKVLTQLMRTKNLQLTRWLQERGLNAGEPLTFASQWRKFYLETYILGDYPTANPKVNKAMEILFKDIDSRYITDDEKALWKKLFKKAKKESLKTLKQWSLSKELNDKLKEHISEIKLHWFSGLKGSPYQNHPQEFLDQAVTYSHQAKKIVMGVPISLFPDQASRFAALVEALAHSFDPCHWPQVFEQENPFLKLESCLRDRQSAHAKKRDDRYLKSWVSRKKLTKKTAQFLKDNPYCNHSLYPPPQIQRDELGEAFAHWFTAEVLAQAEKFKNDTLRADLCEQTHRARQLTSGMTPLDQLLRIYYSQPQLKDRLNATPKYKYCSLEL